HPFVGGALRKRECYKTHEEASVGAVYKAANGCQTSNSPPDTEGVTAPSRIKMRSHRSSADKMVGFAEVFRMRSLKEVSLSTTPSAPLKKASRLLLDVASPPPMSEEKWCAPQFIQTNKERYATFCKPPRLRR